MCNNEEQYMQKETVQVQNVSCSVQVCTLWLGSFEFPACTLTIVTFSWLIHVQDRAYQAPLDLVTQSTLSTRLGPSPRPQRPSHSAPHAPQDVNDTTHDQHVKVWRRNAGMPVLPRLCPQALCTSNTENDRQPPMVADAHTQTIRDVAIQVSCGSFSSCSLYRQHVRMVNALNHAA
jgi:hypothetical protein